MLRFVFLLAVGLVLNLLLSTRVVQSAGLHGDAELLRLAAVEHRANREKLRTWSAKVAITDETRKGDEISVRTTDTVDFVYAQGQGVRWGWEQEWHQNRRGGVDEALPSRFTAKGARSSHDGAFYYRETPAPTPREADGRERFAAYVSADDGSIRAGIKRDKFDPMYFFRRGDEDFAERFMFFHDAAETDANLDTVFVEKKGPLIILELRVPGILNRYVADLDSGGNVVRYFSEEFNQGDDGERRVVASHEWTYEYERVSDVWVPKLTTYKSVSPDGRNSTKRVSRWLKNEVNTQVSPDLFMLQAVGVEPGERVLDGRAGGAIYTYAGAESPEVARSLRGSRIGLASLGVLAIVVAVSVFVLARRRRRAS